MKSSVNTMRSIWGITTRVGDHAKMERERERGDYEFKYEDMEAQGIQVETTDSESLGKRDDNTEEQQCGEVGRSGYRVGRKGESQEGRKGGAGGSPLPSSNSDQMRSALQYTTGGNTSRTEPTVRNPGLSGNPGLLQ